MSGRGKWLFVFFSFLILQAPIAIGESVVGLGKVISIHDSDIGLETAVSSNDGNILLTFGVGNSIYKINSTNPENFDEIYFNGSDDLIDADFHPSDKSALIVGENGLVLRFSRSDNNVTDAGGRIFFGQTELMAISWNGDGSWSYIGGQDGWLWRARGTENGGLDVFPIEDRKISDVTGIDCIRERNFCIISTKSDGIGIIDDDHKITWIGGNGYPWKDVVCPKNADNVCIAISDEKNIATIRINIFMVEDSTIEVIQLLELEGLFTDIFYYEGSKSLISLAPFSIIEHDYVEERSYPWLKNSDVSEYNSEISRELVIYSWTVGQGNGWILTSPGNIIEYSPSKLQEENQFFDEIFAVIIVGLVAAILLTTFVYAVPKVKEILHKER
tara:strand:+ start:1201 stop:2361 length:1161 start_codon:yes stop_codon:yes gene_type:complete